jgi:phasin family protein
MIDPKTFSFDVEKMSEFFKQYEFTKHLANMQMPGFEAEAIMAAQQKNINALVEANKAAAAGYQDLFKKQVQVFEETMYKAQQALKNFDATKVDPEKAKAQGDLAKVAFEKALANMQALAESAQKANAEAYEIVSARIKEGLNAFEMEGVASLAEPKMPELPPHLVSMWTEQAPRRNLAAEFRRMRRRMGLSQAAVAERMGVSQPAVARMESAVGPWPREEAIAAFARACSKDAMIIFRDQPTSGESDVGVVRL